MKKKIKRILGKIKVRLIEWGKLLICFIKAKKTYLIVLLCVILFLLGFIRDYQKNKKEDKENEIKSNEMIGTDNENKMEEINIHIYGGVETEYNGVCEKGYYLFELINKKCSGLTVYATVDEIDLTKLITSDYEVFIPEDEIEKDNTIHLLDYTQTTHFIYKWSGVVDGIIYVYKVDEGITEADYQVIAKKDTSNNGLININTASLETLSSIGKMNKTKATSLIKYREEHGDFQSIEEIKNVSGIGDATFESIKDLICVK